MMKALLLATFGLCVASHSSAQIQITQSKAQAGNVTPGDGAGFPVTISQSGSYILGSNLTATANQHGIVITAPNVSIDLNGFMIDGANVGNRGIYAGANAVNVAVRNGTITRFKLDGISTAAPHWSVDAVRVTKNRRYGILGFTALQVKNSDISENGSDGINADAFSRVEDSIVSLNGGVGVKLVSDGVVLGNAIARNAFFGLSGGGSSGYGNNNLSRNRYDAFSDSYGPDVEPGTAYPLQPNTCGGNSC